MGECCKHYKFKKQDEFWQGIISKYENRNADLERELYNLQERIDHMDASMPAVMAFNMAKLAQQRPESDVNTLVKLPCTCVQSSTKAVFKLPDMSKLSVFSIEEADIQYMDRIKELTDQEKHLIDEVNKLRSKEKALRDTKKKVDDMVHGPNGRCVVVDGADLQSTNMRLLDENRRLSDDVADLRLQIKHLRENVEGPLAREIDRERRKNLQLESELRVQSMSETNKCANASKEISFLKCQLSKEERNLCDMKDINDQLKEEVDFLNRKIEELQNDLINQKLSEANTLALLKSQLGRQYDKPRRPDDHYEGPSSASGPPGGGGGGGGGGAGAGAGAGGPGGPGTGGMGAPRGSSPSRPGVSASRAGAGSTGGAGAGSTHGGKLYSIARDLSNELHDVEGTNKVPHDFEETVGGIKEICDAMNSMSPSIDALPYTDTDTSKKFESQAEVDEDQFEEAAEEPYEEPPTTITERHMDEIDEELEHIQDMEEDEYFVETEDSSRPSQAVQTASVQRTKTPSGVVIEEPPSRASSKMERAPCQESPPPSRIASAHLDSSEPPPPPPSLIVQPQAMPPIPALSVPQALSSKPSSRAPSRAASRETYAQAAVKPKSREPSIDRIASSVPKLAEPKEPSRERVKEGSMRSPSKVSTKDRAPSKQPSREPSAEVVKAERKPSARESKEQQPIKTTSKHSSKISTSKPETAVTGGSRQVSKVSIKEPGSSDIMKEQTKEPIREPTKELSKQEVIGIIKTSKSRIDSVNEPDMKQSKEVYIAKGDPSVIGVSEPPSLETARIVITPSQDPSMYIDGRQQFFSIDVDKRPPSIITTPGSRRISDADEESPEESLAMGGNSRAASAVPVADSTLHELPFGTAITVKPPIELSIEMPQPIQVPSEMPEGEALRHPSADATEVEPSTATTMAVIRIVDEAETEPVKGPSGSVPSVARSKKQAEQVESEYVEQIEAVTEFECGHPCNTDKKLIKKCTDGINVTTTVTRSGMLEVTTEGPSGTLETTMTVTGSGNLEIVTEFTENGGSHTSVETSTTQDSVAQESDFRRASRKHDPGGTRSSSVRSKTASVSIVEMGDVTAQASSVPSCRVRRQQQDATSSMRSKPSMASSTMDDASCAEVALKDESCVCDFEDEEEEDEESSEENIVQVDESCVCDLASPSTSSESEQYGVDESCVCDLEAPEEEEVPEPEEEVEEESTDTCACITVTEEESMPPQEPEEEPPAEVVAYGEPEPEPEEVEPEEVEPEEEPEMQSAAVSEQEPESEPAPCEEPEGPCEALEEGPCEEFEGPCEALEEGPCEEFEGPCEEFEEPCEEYEEPCVEVCEEPPCMEEEEPEPVQCEEFEEPFVEVCDDMTCVEEEEPEQYIEEPVMEEEEQEEIEEEEEEEEYIEEETTPEPEPEPCLVEFIDNKEYCIECLPEPKTVEIDVRDEIMFAEKSEQMLEAVPEVIDEEEEEEPEEMMTVEESEEEEEEPEPPPPPPVVEEVIEEEEVGEEEFEEEEVEEEEKEEPPEELPEVVVTAVDEQLFEEVEAEPEPEEEPEPEPEEEPIPEIVQVDESISSPSLQPSMRSASVQETKQEFEATVETEPTLSESIGCECVEQLPSIQNKETITTCTCGIETCVLCKPITEEKEIGDMEACKCVEDKAQECDVCMMCDKICEEETVEVTDTFTIEFEELPPPPCFTCDAMDEIVVLPPPTVVVDERREFIIEKPPLVTCDVRDETIIERPCTVTCDVRDEIVFECIPTVTCEICDEVVFEEPPTVEICDDRTCDFAPAPTVEICDDRTCDFIPPEKVEICDDVTCEFIAPLSGECTPKPPDMISAVSSRARSEEICVECPVVEAGLIECMECVPEESDEDETTESCDVCCEFEDAASTFSCCEDECVEVYCVPCCISTSSEEAFCDELCRELTEMQKDGAEITQEDCDRVAKELAKRGMDDRVLSDVMKERDDSSIQIIKTSKSPSVRVNIVDRSPSRSITSPQRSRSSQRQPSLSMQTPASTKRSSVVSTERLSSRLPSSCECVSTIEPSSTSHRTPSRSAASKTSTRDPSSVRIASKPTSFTSEPTSKREVSIKQPSSSSRTSRRDQSSCRVSVHEPSCVCSDDEVSTKTPISMPSQPASCYVSKVNSAMDQQPCDICVEEAPPPPYCAVPSKSTLPSVHPSGTRFAPKDHYAPPPDVEELDECTPECLDEPPVTDVCPVPSVCASYRSAQGVPSSTSDKTRSTSTKYSTSHISTQSATLTPEDAPPPPPPSELSVSELVPPSITQVRHTFSAPAELIVEEDEGEDDFLPPDRKASVRYDESSIAVTKSTSSKFQHAQFIKEPDSMQSMSQEAESRRTTSREVTSTTTTTRTPSSRLSSSLDHKDVSSRSASSKRSSQSRDVGEMARGPHPKDCTCVDCITKGVEPDRVGDDLDLDLDLDEEPCDRICSCNDECLCKECGFPRIVCVCKNPCVCELCGFPRASAYERTCLSGCGVRSPPPESKGSRRWSRSSIERTITPRKTTSSRANMEPPPCSSSQRKIAPRVTERPAPSAPKRVPAGRMAELMAKMRSGLPPCDCGKGPQDCLCRDCLSEDDVDKKPTSGGEPVCPCSKGSTSSGLPPCARDSSSSGRAPCSDKPSDRPPCSDKPSDRPPCTKGSKSSGLPPCTKDSSYSRAPCSDTPSGRPPCTKGLTSSGLPPCIRDSSSSGRTPYSNPPSGRPPCAGGSTVLKMEPAVDATSVPPCRDEKPTRMSSALKHPHRASFQTQPLTNISEIPSSIKEVMDVIGQKRSSDEGCVCSEECRTLTKLKRELNQRTAKICDICECINYDTKTDFNEREERSSFYPGGRDLPPQQPPPQPDNESIGSCVCSYDTVPESTGRPSELGQRYRSSTERMSMSMLRIHSSKLKFNDDVGEIDRRRSTKRSSRSGDSVGSGSSDQQQHRGTKSGGRLWPKKSGSITSNKDTVRARSNRTSWKQSSDGATGPKVRGGGSGGGACVPPSDRHGRESDASVKFNRGGGACWQSESEDTISKKSKSSWNKGGGLYDTTTADDSGHTASHVHIDADFDENTESSHTKSWDRTERTEESSIFTVASHSAYAPDGRTTSSVAAAAAQRRTSSKKKKNSNGNGATLKRGPSSSECTCSMKSSNRRLSGTKQQVIEEKSCSNTLQSSKLFIKDMHKRMQSVKDDCTRIREQLKKSLTKKGHVDATDPALASTMEGRRKSCMVKKVVSPCDSKECRRIIKAAQLKKKKKVESLPDTADTLQPDDDDDVSKTTQLSAEGDAASGSIKARSVELEAKTVVPKSVMRSKAARSARADVQETSKKRKSTVVICTVPCEEECERRHHGSIEECELYEEGEEEEACHRLCEEREIPSPQHKRSSDRTPLQPTNLERKRSTASSDKRSSMSMLSEREHKRSSMQPEMEFKRSSISSEHERKKSSESEPRRSSVTSEQEHRRSSMAPEQERRRSTMMPEQEPRRSSLASEQDHRRSSALPEHDRKRSAAHDTKRSAPSVLEEDSSSVCAPCICSTTTPCKDECEKRRMEVLPQGITEAHRKKTSSDAQRKTLSDSQDYRGDADASHKKKASSSDAQSYRGDSVPDTGYRKKTMSEGHSYRGDSMSEHTKKTSESHSYRSDSMPAEPHAKKSSHVRTGSKDDRSKSESIGDTEVHRHSKASSSAKRTASMAEEEATTSSVEMMPPKKYICPPEKRKVNADCGFRKRRLNSPSIPPIPIEESVIATTKAIDECTCKQYPCEDSPTHRSKSQSMKKKGSDSGKSSIEECICEQCHKVCSKCSCESGTPCSIVCEAEKKKKKDVAKLSVEICAKCSCDPMPPCPDPCEKARKPALSICHSPCTCVPTPPCNPECEEKVRPTSTSSRHPSRPSPVASIRDDDRVCRDPCDCDTSTPCNRECELHMQTLASGSGIAQKLVVKPERERSSAQDADRRIDDLLAGIDAKESLSGVNVAGEKAGSVVRDSRTSRHSTKQPLPDCAQQQPPHKRKSSSDELHELVQKITCACRQAEDLTGPVLTKDASDYKSTLSGLQMALQNFQQKCKTKDKLIEAMKEELKKHSGSSVFDSLLNNMANKRPDTGIEDYTASSLAMQFPKPTKGDKPMDKFGKFELECVCDDEQPTKDNCSCVPNSRPLEVMDVRRIGPSSLLLKWKPSESTDVIGYEICVNSMVQARVFSPHRSQAIVDSIEIKGSIKIDIYAMCVNGRCQPPATAIYRM